MNNKKKILFFIPSLSTGGAERVLINLVHKLAYFSNLQIIVVTLFKDDGKLPDNVTYAYVFRKKFRGNVHLLKLLPASWLYRIFFSKYGKVDAAISYLQSPTMRIIAGCPDKNTKLINWIHNEFHNDYNLVKMFRSHTEFKLLMMRYNKHIFVAHSAKDAFSKWCDYIPKEHMEVIYNVNDYSQILTKGNESIEKGIFDKDTFNIISCGRFTPQKAFDRLIDICSRLVKEGLNVHLYLLGKGELEGLYRKQINSLGIEDNVSILGFKSNPFKYVKAADLFVCSSIHEGYSTAVTESLVVGTPVVTTLCSGMVELLGEHNEYGIITENNLEALYVAVKQIISDKSMYARYKYATQAKKVELLNADNVTPVINLFN